MSGKSIKLIIGVVLLVVALALYFFLTSLNYLVDVVIAVVGIIFIVLALISKEKLPAVVSQPETSETPAVESQPETPAEEGVEVPSEQPADSGEEPKSGF
ncbi:hypothetical protein IID20_03660 [Patescibacteria group bacterium]|nr:hypothetical protein [Patescibacteria group bacterium]